jgi:hypothetical protein
MLTNILISRELAMPDKTVKIEVFNINIPGRSSYVQRDKYEEVKRVLKAYMPKRSPGLTQDELSSLVIEHVSEAVFDDRQKAGWWMKTVELDLEARQVVVREKTKPVRWHYESEKHEILPEANKSTGIRRKEILELPVYIKDILVKENVLEAYQNRPFYQRNDYIHWITSAKREETKNKRIKQMLAELKAGNVYMNMAYHRAQ